MRWPGHVAHTEGSAYMDSMVKPEARRPLGRPSSRWEDNVKINFEEME
jgi:hypothetical protein